MELQLFTDGGSRGNPGPSGIGMVIKDEQGRTLAQCWKYTGIGTNNRAEYMALLEGIRYIQIQWPGAVIHCCLDSELVVKQLNGQYRVKHPDLQPLYAQIKLLEMAHSMRYTHIPRERNQEADRLANKAMDERSEGCITPEL